MLPNIGVQPDAPARGSSFASAWGLAEYTAQQNPLPSGGTNASIARLPTPKPTGSPFNSAPWS
jgi:hypothetical protein